MNFLKNVGKGISGALTGAGIEMPQYEVTNTTEKYEERSYPETCWVSTEVLSMTRKDAGTQGFWRCFKYIQGANEKECKIDMTAPVAIKVIPGAGPNCESTFIVSFYMGKEHAADPPQPTNPELYIERWPAMKAYIKQFSGFASDDTWTAMSLELAKDLPGDAQYCKDSYYHLGYDSPFKLFNRRNEVCFIATQSGSNQPENGAHTETTSSS